MSNDDLLKMLIGITSAFAGWILAQFTSAAKAWLQRRKIGKLLLEELGDLRLEVQRLRLFYGRQLQIHGAKGIGNTTTAQLTNHVFRTYYKDALLSLNQSQRISYQLIHSLVESVNVGLAEFRKMTTDIQNEHFENGLSGNIAKAGEAWGQKASAEYQHCASLLWQIDYHLRTPSSPELSAGTKPHQDFLEFRKVSKAEAERLIDSGKTIDRSEFVGS